MTLFIQRLKNYYKVHYSDSNDFIIMYVLTKIFKVWIYKNKFCPNHGNQFILTDILNIFPIDISQILFNNCFLNLMHITWDLPYLILVQVRSRWLPSGDLLGHDFRLINSILFHFQSTVVCILAKVSLLFCEVFRIFRYRVKISNFRIHETIQYNFGCIFY